MVRTKVSWDATSVKGLRRHMRLTQDQLAEALGVRQQTVSEWETSLHAPRGASARLLTLVAEQADFAYETSAQQSDEDSPQSGEETQRPDGKHGR